MEMGNGEGFTEISLRDLGLKPRGQMITPAWQYLKAAHSSVQGIFDGLSVVRRTRAEARDEFRGRLGTDEQNLLRAALVFTSSGLDACCKRLVRDTASALIEGNADAARKFDEYLAHELAVGPSDPVATAIRSKTPRDELIKLYVAARTKASMQGSEDLRKRVRDTLGIPNAKVSKQRLALLDPFFTARNDIVHDMDYEDPSGTGAKRHTRVMESVRGQCDEVFAVASELIASTAANVRALP
ncbi:hypothetical protein [Streptomyces sp. OspMP-M43]|uniref:hypothetical protein n=1 Tax=Streptomyces sp. OspMP-M43 TaxID=1839781 RepID=UPI00114CFB4F|nr:hypothetical protein [Streptomyces sp. OspMP-M43]